MNKDIRIIGKVQDKNRDIRNGRVQHMKQILDLVRSRIWAVLLGLVDYRITKM